MVYFHLDPHPPDPPWTLFTHLDLELLMDIALCWNLHHFEENILRNKMMPHLLILIQTKQTKSNISTWKYLWAPHLLILIQTIRTKSNISTWKYLWAQNPPFSGDQLMTYDHLLLDRSADQIETFSCVMWMYSSTNVRNTLRISIKLPSFSTRGQYVKTHFPPLLHKAVRN
jgi:hypothetical protein